MADEDVLTPTGRGGLSRIEWLATGSPKEPRTGRHRPVPSRETWTRVLEPDHPDTLTSRSNLAHILYECGRPDDAEAEHRAVLETRTRVLGPDHPDTLSSRSNLSLVLRDLGRLDQAERAAPPPGTIPQRARTRRVDKAQPCKQAMRRGDQSMISRPRRVLHSVGEETAHSPRGALPLASWQPGHGSMHARPTRDGKGQRGSAEWPPRSSTTRHGLAAGCRI